MATKAKDWHSHFRKLLAPRLLSALKSDRAGKAPLRPAVRRQMTSMLRIVMTTAEIRAALVGTPAKKKIRGKRQRKGRRTPQAT